MTQSDQPNFFKLQKVRDGVFAAISADSEKTVGNAAIVDLGDSTLVLDTFASPQAAMALRQAAVEVTGREPAWVLNSHHHGDHVMGNQVFGETATIIATQETHAGIVALEQRRAGYRAQLEYDLEAAQKRGAKEGEKATRIQEQLTNLDALIMTPPTVLYENKLILQGSQRRAEILTLGGGHSPSDSLIYLPADGVMLMADLLFQGQSHPWVGDGNPANWIRILGEILEMSAASTGAGIVDTFVPGHGEVGTRDDVIIQLEYLRDFAQVVERKRNTPDWEIEVADRYQTWEGEAWFKRGVEALISRG